MWGWGGEEGAIHIYSLTFAFNLKIWSNINTYFNTFGLSAEHLQIPATTSFCVESFIAVKFTDCCENQFQLISN